MPYSWTQPACTACWEELNPHRRPVRLTKPEVDVCVYCGERTRSGIYVRIDPMHAPHPTMLKEA